MLDFVIIWLNECVKFTHHHSFKNLTSKHLSVTVSRSILQTQRFSKVAILSIYKYSIIKLEMYDILSMTVLKSEMFLMSFWKKSVAPASFSPDEKYNSSEGHVIKRVFSLSVLKSMVDLIYKNKIIFEHKFKNKHSEQKKIFVTVLHRHISTKI